MIFKKKSNDSFETMKFVLDFAKSKGIDKLCRRSFIDMYNVWLSEKYSQMEIFMEPRKTFANKKNLKTFYKEVWSVR